MDDAELAALLDEERATGRGRARSRERAHRQVAEEGASLVGTLLDLAEGAGPVTVRTVAGRTHHGALVAVGADFCVLRSQASDTYVRIHAVVTVRPHAPSPAAVATGGRVPVHDVRLMELLAVAAASRPRVSVVVRDGDVVAGELRSVGVDVVTLRLDGERRGLCYLAAGAITEVALSG